MLLSNFFFSKLALMVNFFADQFSRQDTESMLAEPNFGANLGLPVPEIYDFIIVGGGSAGCLVANRLASANFSVLLLEAGGNPPELMRIPIGNEFASHASEIIYNYDSIPQSFPGAPEPKSIKLMAGKVLGGTSVINAVFFNRGHPYDFDNWANITGDSSWRYENLREHFKAFENYTGDHLDSHEQEHGFQGELAVETEAYQIGWDYIRNAAQELGYEAGIDPNGPQKISYTKLDANKRNGRKVNSYEAFIANVPAERLASLDIRRYSKVQKILLHPNNTAYGVQYYRHDFPEIAYARNEVIVSAGAFGSPLLLLRSGIGPAEELAALNITPVLDLPVGRNLQDHPAIAVPIYLEDNRDIYNHENLTMADLTAFLQNGTNLLSTRHTRSGQAFLVSQAAVAEGQPEWPDAHAVFYFSRGTVPSNIEENIKGHVIDFTIYLGRPRSAAGTVKLNPTDIMNGPALVDLQHLSNDINRAVFVDAIKDVLRLAENTTAFGQQLGAKLVDSPLLAPACNNYTFRSDEYWNCYVDNVIRSGQHITGTCRMGPANNGGSVVDSRLRVHGATGLRVIDASVMPEITNTNILAPVFAIAQKTATEIINQYRLI